MSPDDEPKQPGGAADDIAEMVETEVPLDGIAQEAAELIELYGGRIRSSAAQRIEFTLPNRRGVIASGGMRCELSWSGESAAGTIRLVSGDAFEGPSLQHVALLIAGAAGSIVCILWPFFPSLTPAAGIGAVLAIGAYLLTLRRSGANVAADLLRRLVVSQREKAEPDAE